MIDLFKEIKQKINGNLPNLIKEMFPEAKESGEWLRVGDMSGEKGTSLAINIREGHFVDHATDEKGDFITLYQLKMGHSKPIDAAKELAQRFGIDINDGARPSHANKGSRKTINNALQRAKPSEPEFKPKPIRVQKDETIPEPKVYQGTNDYGDKVTDTYYYRNPDESIHCIVARYQPHDKEKRKYFKPFHMKDGKWKMGMPETRILYGLEKLTKDCNILLVEGEKAAHAAHKLLGNNYCVLSWPMGSSGAHHKKLDLSPLKDRDILIWPDADKAGLKAAKTLCETLKSTCKRIRYVNVSDDGKGWDLADALEEGMNTEQVIEMGKKLVKIPEENEHVFTIPQTGMYEYNNGVIKEQPIPLDVDLGMSEPPQFEDIPMEAYSEAPQQQTGTSNVVPFEKPKKKIKQHSAKQVGYLQKWTDMGLDIKDNGKEIYATESNIMKIFMQSELSKMVWLDTFHHKIFVKSPGSDEAEEIKDSHATELLIYVQEKFGIYNLAIEKFEKTMAYYAETNKKNEVLEWMDSLKWDGKPRIDGFFPKYMRASDPVDYLNLVSRYFWCSMVSRIYKPGRKADAMVILEGKQGAYKSTACEVIGGKWFKEIHEKIGSADFKLSLKGAMLGEMSELTSMIKSNAKVEQIKGTLSSRMDEFRAPYGRHFQTTPRQCVFIGTTNADNYLGDETGGRRFMPVRCQDIDIEAIKRDRDQLFAEAIERRHESWHDLPSDLTAAQQDMRFSEDSWMESIEDWLDKQNGPCQKLSNQILWRLALGSPNLVSLKPSDHTRIRKIMIKLGYKQSGIRYDKDGKKMRSWVFSDLAKEEQLKYKADLADPINKVTAFDPES